MKTKLLTGGFLCLLLASTTLQAQKNSIEPHLAIIKTDSVTNDTATTAMIARFFMGERDSVFTKQALTAVLSKSRFAVLDQMLAQLNKENKAGKDTWRFFWMAGNKNDDKVFRFIAERKALFISRLGVNEMDNYFAGCLSYTISHYVSTGHQNTAYSDEIKTLIEQSVTAEEQQRLALGHLDMAEAKMAKNLRKMLKVYQKVLVKESQGNRYLELSQLIKCAIAFGSRLQCEDMVYFVLAELKQMGAPGMQRRFEENELALLRRHTAQLKGTL